MKINIIALVNAIWSLIIVVCIGFSTETFSGGMCTYWRCMNELYYIGITMIVIQFMLNLVYVLWTISDPKSQKSSKKKE